MSAPSSFRLAIAEELGVTRERIRQIEHAALGRLRVLTAALLARVTVDP